MPSKHRIGVPAPPSSYPRGVFSARSPTYRGRISPRAKPLLLAAAAHLVLAGGVTDAIAATNPIVPTAFKTA
jgi:hypothetical protein